MASNNDLRIEMASEKDVPLLLTFIRELALYERLLEVVTTTEEDLRSTLFGAEACAQGLLAYKDDDAVAFAIYFFNYSTFSGRPGLYLEDIFIRPAHRGAGVGRQIFSFLAQIALARGCNRMEWAVLNWNAPAIGFYESLGARPMHDWTTFRLPYEQLQRMSHTTAKSSE